jgi:hypothetical protein
MAQENQQQKIKYCSKEQELMFSKGLSNTELVRAGRKGDQWAEILFDTEHMREEEFKSEWPREWILERGPIDKIMIEAAQRRLAKDWDGDLYAKNVWLLGEPGIGKNRWAG